jgi:hypothetical protein
MLITFKTSAYANITMLGDAGKKMLEMMAFGTSVPGAISAADVPRALENLRQALSKIPALPPQDDDDGEPRVGLHTRAAPLLELLQAAIADEKTVRWE